MRQAQSQSEGLRIWIMLSAATCLVVLSGLAMLDSMMALPPPVGDAISDTPVLLVVERDGCGWCTRFRAELGPGYKSSDLQMRAPLRYIDAGDLRASKRYQLKNAVNGTPTLLMIDTFGREVARYPGYPGSMENMTNQVNSMLRWVR
jgi:hypothetical protein